MVYVEPVRLKAYAHVDDPMVHCTDFLLSKVNHRCTKCAMNDVRAQAAPHENCTLTLVSEAKNRNNSHKTKKMMLLNAPANANLWRDPRGATLDKYHSGSTSIIIRHNIACFAGQN